MVLWVGGWVRLIVGFQPLMVISYWGRIPSPTDMAKIGGKGGIIAVFSVTHSCTTVNNALVALRHFTDYSAYRGFVTDNAQQTSRLAILRAEHSVYKEVAKRRNELIEHQSEQLPELQKAVEAYPRSEAATEALQILKGYTGGFISHTDFNMCRNHLIVLLLITNAHISSQWRYHQPYSRWVSRHEKGWNARHLYHKGVSPQNPENIWSSTHWSNRRIKRPLADISLYEASKTLSTHYGRVDHYFFIKFPGTPLQSTDIAKIFQKTFGRDLNRTRNRTESHPHPQNQLWSSK